MVVTAGKLQGRREEGREEGGEEGGEEVEEERKREGEGRQRRGGWIGGESTNTKLISFNRFTEAHPSLKVPYHLDVLASESLHQFGRAHILSSCVAQST